MSLSLRNRGYKCHVSCRCIAKTSTFSDSQRQSGKEAEQEV